MNIQLIEQNVQMSSLLHQAEIASEDVLSMVQEVSNVLKQMVEAEKPRQQQFENMTAKFNEMTAFFVCFVFSNVFEFAEEYAFMGNCAFFIILGRRFFDGAV